FVEKGDGVGFGDLFDRAAGIEREEDGDEALDDHGIGFAAIDKGRASVRSLRLLGHEPDLRNAAMDLVSRSLVGRIEPRQPLPELDDIAVTLLPIIEKGKVFGDVGEGGGCGHTPYLVNRAGYFKKKAAWGAGQGVLRSR